MERHGQEPGLAQPSSRSVVLVTLTRHSGGRKGPQHFPQIDREALPPAPVLGARLGGSGAGLVRISALGPSVNGEALRSSVAPRPPPKAGDCLLVASTYLRSPPSGAGVQNGLCSSVMPASSHCSSSYSFLGPQAGPEQSSWIHWPFSRCLGPWWPQPSAAALRHPPCRAGALCPSRDRVWRESRPCSGSLGWFGQAMAARDSVCNTNGCLLRSGAVCAVGLKD